MLEQQYDRLVGGSRLVHPRLCMSAIPQSSRRQAILTALYGNAALLRPPYWDTSAAVPPSCTLELSLLSPRSEVEASRSLVISKNLNSMNTPWVR